MQNAITHASSILVLAQQQAPQQGFGMGTLVFMGLAMAGMYFLMIAPQRKKQKEMEKMLKAITSGDEVLTAGGIYGTVTNVKDDRLVVRIADGTKVEVARSFVQSVVNKAAAS